MTASNEPLTLDEIKALPPGAIVRTGDGRAWVCHDHDETMTTLDWRWMAPVDDAAATDRWMVEHGAVLVGAVSHTPAADALVSHGWGPKPTVSREQIAAAFGPEIGPSMALDDRLVVFLRECGIEVTDGD